MTLLTGHSPALAVGYGLSSIVAALVAVWCGMKAARFAASLSARIASRYTGGGQ
jgi:hypothetical protein